MNKSKQKLTLDRPATYQIKVPGHLNERWTDWAGGMTVTVESDSDGSPVTTLTGTVDQAALQGLLRRLYSLGLPLISVYVSIAADSLPIICKGEKTMKNLDKHQIVGWIGVGFSTAIICFWAVWGILETFHEGWYFESLLSNLGLMFVQYLSPMLIFMGVALISIFWPRIGGGLHVIFALLAIWFFQSFTNPGTFLFIPPLIGIGALYWFGRPPPRKIAVSLAVGLPILILIISGIGPVLRVSQRFDDGNHQARLVHGNGVDLVWAPEGPGWPRKGENWDEARLVCQYLSEDGLTIALEPLHIWRLPTVEEAVRSMALHGQNSGGVWDEENSEAVYKIPPDKESPLWNIYSQVIYWWTATEVDEEHAYIIAYDGKVWSRTKLMSPDYLGFRCVKQP